MPGNRKSLTEVQRSRRMMTAALKAIVVTSLHDMGFRGSFPYYSRQREARVDLLWFRFTRGRERFLVEIAVCPSVGQMGTTRPKLRKSAQTEGSKMALGALSSEASELPWFDFSADCRTGHTDIALKVLPLLRGQAEHFWLMHEHI